MVLFKWEMIQANKGKISKRTGLLKNYIILDQLGLLGIMGYI